MDSLWQETLRHLSEGNYTSLQDHLGGPEGFHSCITQWHADGKFDNYPELLAEAFTCACMLGRTATAVYLLDSGIDAYAGTLTGFAGPHHAVSSGRLDTVRMLLSRGIATEIPNSYGGTMLEQALWSIVNEPKPFHRQIIELLIEHGAMVDRSMLDRWREEIVGHGSELEPITKILERRMFAGSKLQLVAGRSVRKNK